MKRLRKAKGTSHSGGQHCPGEEKIVALKTAECLELVKSRILVAPLLTPFAQMVTSPMLT
jgi:hypothetical protein